MAKRRKEITEGMEEEREEKREEKKRTFLLSLTCARASVGEEERFTFPGRIFFSISRKREATKFFPSPLTFPSHVEKRCMREEDDTRVS